MKRLFQTLCSFAMVLLVTGCAHPISLSADVAALSGTGNAKVDRKVGMVMNDDMRKREVISPGGGGDKVSYQPYRDLETGLYVALSESFSGVARVSGPADAKVQAEGLQLLVTPSIATTSYSPSLVTWPPTVFTVELTCSITDAQNKPVTEVKVQGEGRAEFDEFKADFSLSAKRASADALKKLVKALGDAAAKLR
ncbi:hypothetical protein BurJ1DRAFT_3843 [Burkholderiales bacterium JOSHI_001]|nr:hypothetical protein BurJ1DRAFT_3843 [Burkholderiales bacterium JOSHI_001]